MQVIQDPFMTKDFQKAIYTRSRLKNKMNKTPTMIASVIRQKGESENGCFKKTQHAKFSEKRTFLTILIGYEMFASRKIWRALFS